MQSATCTCDLTGLILQRVRLLSERRVAWLRKIWAGIGDNGTEGFTAHMEIDGYLMNRDVPALEKQWYEQDPGANELSWAIEETDHAIYNNENSRLSELTDVLGLNRMESDILQICFAFAIDPGLGRVFAYLQDHSGRGYITESLIARLFGYGYGIVISSNSPLKTLRLVKETPSGTGEPSSFECDPFIRNWMLGTDGTDETLVSFTALQPVLKSLQKWPVDRTVYEIEKMLHNTGTNKLRVFVEGAERSGRRSFAAIVSHRLGFPLLSLNADRVPETTWLQTYMFAQRQSFLSNAALLWHGASMPDRYWSSFIPAFPLQFVTGEEDDHLLPEDGFIDMRVVLPRISVEERQELWKKLLPDSQNWQTNEMQEMVLRHDTTIGQIASIGQRMTATIADAYEALNADSSRRLGNLARQMNSDFTFDDLVLPENTRLGLEDFIFEASERIFFWEEAKAKRLFPQGKSLIGLFTGSPGTGKTMAAQVIASSLKLDLFRIDLSMVVSKYVGESSKNLERIFSRAKNMNLVLLFDEADSLCGKRTEIKDAHDRYANTDTNYLLQAIESYPGIIILASNKKSNIDNGFIRRLRYQFDFPQPDVEQRHAIWRKIVGELLGDEIRNKLDGDLFRLSGLVEITGAQIKQSILSAIFMARKEKSDLKTAHLLRGLERELAKESKGLAKEVYKVCN